MFDTPYYHGVIKKLIIGMGTLFSNVQIIRETDDALVTQTINVPVSYGPKEKWYTRTSQDPELANNVGVTLPRMGFEITGYMYDADRMVNKNHVIKHYNNAGVATSVWAPVPYNVDITLTALTKGTEDGLAIVEQLLPVFAPEYTLNLRVIPEMNITQDVPVILTGVSVQDDWEGDFMTKRLVEHTFNFTAKINLYGPVKGAKIITSTTATVDASSAAGTDQTYNATGVPSTGVVTDNGWTFN